MSDHLIITVHGIRTYGQWQERFESLFPKQHRDKITFVHYKLGYFSFLKFLVPPARWFVTSRFKRYLRKELEVRQWRRVDLVGHSFGTHVIGWALRDLGNKKRQNIHTVLFASSVLKSNFSWSNILGNSVKRVVNDCSVNDFPLILSQLFSLFTGNAGREGFIGPTSRKFRNRYFKLGHSGYFSACNESGAKEFMEEYWIPLFILDRKVDTVDCRSPSMTTGFITWLCNNAEPIKILFYLTPVVLFGVWINGLYSAADTAEKNALTNESRALALLADHRTEESEFIDAIKLGLDALPGSLSISDRPYLPEAETSLYRASLAFRHRTKRSFTARERIVGLFVGFNTSRVITVSDDDGIMVSSENILQVWDVERETPIFERGITGIVSAVTLSQDGKRFAFKIFSKNVIGFGDIENGNYFEHPVDERFRSTEGVTFSADGKRLTSINIPKNRNEAAVLQSWEIDDDKGFSEGVEVPLEGAANNTFGAFFKFDPKGQYVWTGRGEEIWIWSVSSGKRVGVLPRYRVEQHVQHTEPARRVFFGNIMAFSPDGKHLVATSEDNAVGVWEVESNTRVALLSGHRDLLRDATFSPDGTRVATASADGTARVWDVRNLKSTFPDKSTGNNSASVLPRRLIAVLKGHEAAVTRVAFASDSRILTTSLDNSLREWDADNGLELFVLRRFAGRGANVRTVIGPNARQILTVSTIFTGIQGKEVRVWDLETGIRIPTFVGSGPRKNRVVVSPNGRRAITTIPPQHDIAHVWDVESGRLVALLSGHDGEIYSADFDSHGSHVVTASADNTVRLWEVGNEDKSTTLPGHGDIVIFAAFSPNDNRIVTASRDQTIRVWDRANRSLIHEIPFQYNLETDQDITEFILDLLALYPIEFSPDSKYIAISTMNFSHRTLEIWDTKKKEQRRKFTVLNTPKQGWLPLFDFCPHNGQILVVSREDTGQALVVDIETGENQAVIKGHNEMIMSAAFNQDCSRIVTASLDRTARVWEVESEHQIAKLSGHEGTVMHAAFSPGGQRVVTASEDMTVRVWDIDSEEPTANLPLNHTNGVALRAEFSSDGARLITVSADSSGFANQTVRIFPSYTTQSLIDHAQSVLTANIGGHLD